MASKAVGFVTFKFGANLEGFQKGMKKAQMSLNKFGKSMKRTGKNLSRSLTLPLLALGAAAVKSFHDQAQAEQKLLTALDGQVGVQQRLIEQAKELQTLTIFGDEETIAAQSMLAMMGLQEEEIIKLIPLIQDFASAKGMDLVTAADLVAKSMGSSTNALSRYGIEITGAVGSSERLETAVDQLTDKFAGQAEESAKVGAGPLIQIKNQMGDLAEELGGALMPYVIEFVEWLKSWVDWFGELNESQKDMTAKVMLFVMAIGPALFILGGIGTAIGVIVGVVGFFVTAIKTATSVQHFFNLVLNANPIGIIITVIGLIIAAVWYFSTSTSKVAVKVRNAFRMMANGVIKVLNGLIWVFNKVSGAIGGPTISKIKEYTMETHKAADATEELGDEAEETAKELTKIEKIHKKVGEDTDKQVENVYALVSVLQDETAAIEDQETALTELQKIAPEFFGEYELGVSTFDDLATATDGFTNALIRNAKIAAVKDQLQPIIAKIAEYEIRMAKARRNHENWVAAVNSGQIDAYDMDLAEEKFGEFGAAMALRGGHVEFQGETGHTGVQGESLTTTDFSDFSEVDVVWETGNVSIDSFLTSFQLQVDHMKEEMGEIAELLPEMSISSILGANLRNKQKTGGDKAKKKEKTPFEIDLEQLEDNHLEASNILKQSLLDKKEVLKKDLEDNKITQAQFEEKSLEAKKEYDQKSLENELSTLQIEKTLREKHVEDLLEIEEEIIDAKLDLQDFLESATGDEDPFKNYRDSLGKLGETIAEFTGTKLKDLENGLAEISMSLGDELASGAEDFEEYGKNVLGVLKDIIGGLISAGVAAAISKALKDHPFLPFWAIPIIAGAAAGLAKTAFNSLIPEFAQGGLVTGPTAALIGEGIGTNAANPEVIAPLDKLKKYMGGNQNITVQGKLVGNDIYLSNERTKFNRNRTV